MYYMRADFDFVERNGTWLLTVLDRTGVIGSLLARYAVGVIRQVLGSCNRTVMSVSEIKEMEAKNKRNLPMRNKCHA